MVFQLSTILGKMDAFIWSLVLIEAGRKGPLYRTEGTPSSSVSSIALDSTGNLYAGGAFTTASLTQVSTTTTSGSNMITLPSVAGLEIGMSCLNFTSYPVEITEINSVTNVVTLRDGAITTGPTTLSCYWPSSNYITKWNGSSWQKFNS